MTVRFQMSDRVSEEILRVQTSHGRDDTPFDFGCGEYGFLTGNYNVTVEHYFRSSAVGSPIDGCNHWLAGGLPARNRAEPVPVLFTILGFAFRRFVGMGTLVPSALMFRDLLLLCLTEHHCSRKEVRACTECSSFSRDDDYPE